MFSHICAKDERIKHSYEILVHTGLPHHVAQSIPPMEGKREGDSEAGKRPNSSLLDAVHKFGHGCA